MEPKKTPQADLENKKILFFQIGMVVTLLFVFFAFEWSSGDDDNYSLGELVVSDELEMEIPPTKQEQKPPPPPPPPKLEIVEDEEEIEEVELQETEVDEETAIEIEEIEEEIEEPDIFTIVEDPPAFPGGVVAMMKYIQKNVKYPPIAKENGITGKVFVTFVVNETGTITDVKILKGIGAGCDEEAVRVVRSMPKWKPGKQRGKAVKCHFNLPIRFSLK